MVSSTQLFELIKSMTPSEKRHFRLYASKHIIGEKNNYMKLFEAVAMQEKYDEDRIRKKYRHESFVKHLPYEKNYLYEMIADSLHVFHLDNGAESKFKKRLHHVSILFEKGLFKHCDKILRKIEEQAMQLERYHYVYEALVWQKRILGQRSYSGVREKHLDEIQARTLSVILKMKNHTEYSNLSEKLRFLIDTSGQVRSKKQKKRFDRVIRHPLMKTEQRALSDAGRRIYNSIKMNYHFYTNGKLKEIIRHTTRELELMEANPEQVRENPNSYIGVLGNIIITFLEQKNFNEAMLYLERLRNIPQKFNVRLKTNLRIKLFVLQYSQELTLYIEAGTFGKVNDVITDVESGLKEFEGKISKTNAITIYYNLAYLYIGTGENKLALKWLNKILAFADVDAREDIICFAKLLQLIVYFELNDTDTLPYVIRSTFRYLINRKKVYKGETMIMNFIRKLPRLDSRQKLRQGYEELKKELTGLSGNPFENNIFLYFDFISWLESKIEGKSFAEVVKAKKIK